MRREQVLWFRYERQGLGKREGGGLDAAAACPASDFDRDAAMLALAARSESLTRETFGKAIDSGEVVLAPIIRGAIHALRPDDFALLGRTLIATDEDELGRQIGQQMRRISKATGIAVTDALAEVTAATEDSLKGSAKLDKNELHDALRTRVREELMPWCKGCESHHVAPMLWRYAAVAAGARRDSQGHYLIGRPKPKGKPEPAEAVRFFLRFYGPAKVSHFTSWAGVAPAMSKRLWEEVADELTEVEWREGGGSVLEVDAADLEAAEKPEGVRLLPPRDPYVTQQDRDTLLPDEALRKRLFRPAASPGAVVADGVVAGTWRAKAKGKRAQVTVEAAKKLPKKAVEGEAERIAKLRGAEGLEIVWA